MDGGAPPAPGRNGNRPADLRDQGAGLSDESLSDDRVGAQRGRRYLDSAG
jgi:hypothetical protein